MKRPWISGMTAALVLVLLLLLPSAGRRTEGAPNSGAPSVIDPSVPALPIARLLQPDGMLNTQIGYHGSLDPTGWRMLAGANQAPRFVPITAPPAPHTTPSPRTVGLQVPGDANWDARFGPAGSDGVIYTAAISGTNLYVGGSFTLVGGVPTRNIARWDGAAWSALGTGVDHIVYALALNGSDVYAGGDFLSAGGGPASYVARWDTISNQWFALGGGPSGWVFALAVSGSDLYVGGRFYTAGGVPANHIARWSMTGSQWYPLGTGVTSFGDGDVWAIAISAGTLYAGGAFTSAGDAPANHIARWDSIAGQWSALGSGASNGVGGNVYAIALRGSDLYAGGAFGTAGGTTAGQIARWDGSQWSILGSGLTGGASPVHTLLVRGNDLYVGGGFTTAGSVSARGLARWDAVAQQWHALGGVLNNGVDGLGVWTLVGGADDLYLGGSFTHAGGLRAGNVVRWTTTGLQWSTLGTQASDGLDETTFAIAVSGPDVYVGGRFAVAGEVPANHIAHWNGSQWAALGSGSSNGVNDTVYAIAVQGTAVYVGGVFTAAGGVSASRIAWWNSATNEWAALGGGLNDDVKALAVRGTAVYAGGYFTTAGGVAAHYVACWDTVGNQWAPLGSSPNDGVNGPVLALAADGSAVYVGGSFSSAGGGSAGNIARWTPANSQWTPLGPGVNDTVEALVLQDTDLYAGGFFTAAGAVSLNEVGRWHTGTQQWTRLNGGLGNGPVFALASNGTQLYAGGEFTWADGLQASRVAAWDLTAGQWSILGSGLDARAQTLAGSGSRDLYVGGFFAHAGSNQSVSLAVWHQPLPPTATPTAPPTVSPTATPSCQSARVMVTSPNAGPGSNGLVAVAARTSGDIWAVGTVRSDTITRNLIQHWDGTQWTIVPSPNQSSSADALNAVAIVSATDVWAAGDYAEANDWAHPAMLHWDGSAWQVVPVPQPSGAQAGSLSGLTARAADDVWAVGSYNLYGYWRTLTLHWNGSSWSIVSSPNPPAPGDFALNGVATAATGDVWAVGASRHGPGTPDDTLVEHWNGSAWTIVPAVNIANQDTYFNALTVLSGSDIWAVGYTVGSSARQTLVEHWNGTAWSVVPSPNSGMGNNVLSAVAGSAPNDLWAAGSAMAATTYGSVHEALLLHWDGTQWRTQIPPGSPNYKELYGLAALGSSNVWAVGSDRTAGDYATLVQQWDGTQWQARLSPNSGSGDNVLAGVAVVAAQDVWAVGSKNSGTLTLHWDGSTWQVVPSPNSPVGRSRLAAVAARASDDVWAVGSYRWTPDELALGTFIEHWDGSQWHIVPSPNLAPGGSNELTAVVLRSATDGWAVGQYRTSTTVGTLIVHWDGSTWQAVPSPNPAGATDLALTGVVAPAAGDVWAVGKAYVAGYYQTLTMHWNGAQWRLVVSPNPGGPAQNNTLGGIAARAGTDLWAVGSYSSSSPPYLTGLTLHWDGSAWQVVPAERPGGTGNYAFTAVAALGADRLGAVGSVANTQPLFEQWDGSAWRVVPGDTPAGSSLAAVAAVSAGEAWAVGFQSSDPVQHTLVERYVDPCSGSPAPPTPTGIPQPSPTPSGSPASVTATHTGTPAPATAPPSGSPAPATATATLCLIHFSDVTDPTAYYYQPVYALACHGVLSGYSDGTFRPYNQTTRAQLTKIIVGAAGWAVNTSGGPHFSDVAVASTFYPYIETAVNHGIISGYSDGTFRPSANVTRGQLSKIIVGAQGWAIQTNGGPHFRDVPAGNNFYPAIETAYAHGIISGYSDGTFRPANSATRGQIAKIVALAVPSP